MMKKSISWMVFLLLMTAACAQAAPQLTNVTADGESLHAGEGWTVSFETTEGGALAMQLARRRTGETVRSGRDAGGRGERDSSVWDGVLPDGSAAADGVYTVAVQLRNYWGEESEESLLPLTIGGNERGGFRRAGHAGFEQPRYSGSADLGRRHRGGAGLGRRRDGERASRRWMKTAGVPCRRRRASGT